MAATDAAADMEAALRPASTPSGLPLAPEDPREALQGMVMGALADALSNPGNPLRALVQDQAAHTLENAGAEAVSVWAGMTQPVPGRSAGYYVACTGGCVALAGANYYAAWALEPDQKLLRVLSFLQGTALVAAAAINLQKAQRAG